MCDFFLWVSKFIVFPEEECTDEGQIAGRRRQIVHERKEL